MRLVRKERTLATEQARVTLCCNSRHTLHVVWMWTLSN